MTHPRAKCLHDERAKVLYVFVVLIHSIAALEYQYRAFIPGLYATSVLRTRANGTCDGSERVYSWLALST